MSERSPSGHLRAFARSVREHLSDRHESTSISCSRRECVVAPTVSSPADAIIIRARETTTQVARSSRSALDRKEKLEKSKVATQTATR
jgi:hypothetical protein